MKKDDNMITVSPNAYRLRERAAHIGLIAALKEYDSHQRVRIPFRSYMSDISIQGLNLSVRASDGLMRSGTTTLGKLMALMESEQGLIGIRNLGIKSVREITRAFLCGTYERLTTGEQAVYWQRIIENA